MFQILSGGSSLFVSSRGGGCGCKVFGREAPENGAEGAVLENFSDFSENLFLKNEIKS